MIDLTGRVAVVLAAGSGLGRASTLRLAQLGASVAAVDGDDLAVAGTALLADEPQVVRDYAVDDGRPAALDDTRRRIEADLGVPDIVVADVRRTGGVVARTFFDGMIRRARGGRVVTVTDTPRPGGCETVAFSMDLARELAPYGILVNCVAAGPVDVARPSADDEADRLELTRRIPLRRLAHPDEIASAVAFLASDQASYITGQVLAVNGGLTMYR